MAAKRKGALWRHALLLVWMALIFWFSSEDGVDSGDRSRLLVVLLQSLGFSENTETVAFVVRKLAHFGLYLVLGFLSMLAFERWVKNVKTRAFWALGFVLAYAVTDEVHQIFVPGRSGQLSDVLIDTLGGLIGVLAYAALAGAFKK